MVRVRPVAAAAGTGAYVFKLLSRVAVNMGRPQIDDDVLDLLEASVDARTKVPASHLTTEERLAFALDELADAASRVEYLEGRVDTLEEKVEEARADDAPTDEPGAIDGVDLGTGSTRRPFDT